MPEGYSTMAHYYEYIPKIITCQGTYEIFGHFLSTTFQLSPVEKTILLMDSKYPSSSFGFEKCG